MGRQVCCFSESQILMSKLSMMIGSIFVQGLLFKLRLEYQHKPVHSIIKLLLGTGDAHRIALFLDPLFHNLDPFNSFTGLSL